METINVDVFARQLIADKCSALLESQNMLPEDILVIVKRARDEYFKDPSNKNYEYIKRLFSQTKYVDDAIDYKDFNRRILLIAFKFALNKAKNYFQAYRTVLEVALRRLDGINPDLKSSPRAMLQHYNECLENLDNPRNDEHHLVVFGKEIATKIFIETIDLYSYNNKSPFEQTTTATINANDNNRGTSYAAASSHVVSSKILMDSTIDANKRKKIKATGKRITSNYKIATPLFCL
ncbi:AC106 [Trabala vishnou gigantina nucleopolyhedrovirus]|uniref:AC106 n=1 Tax=Trabala vishnou gigantina nucleopolyhedrovirus TaxID=2863583 RepID=UPI002481BF9D|nr:AC106 [Trabala vishnou gigantina nucleopolyhedrovirus]QYC92728.1 AC106 [Trabala vishnou gigantina nucleopolyhedrovirus]